MEEPEAFTSTRVLQSLIESSVTRCNKSPAAQYQQNLWAYSGILLYVYITEASTEGSWKKSAIGMYSKYSD